MVHKIALLALLPTMTIHGQSIPRDKQLHLVTGAIGGIGTAYVAKKLGAKYPILWALGVGLAVGAAKELYDRQHRDRHTPELLDGLATLTGSGLGGFSVVFRF